MNIYVNDLLKSLRKEEETIEVIHDVKKMCAKGGFNLTNFVSNSRRMMMTMSPSKVISFPVGRIGEVNCPSYEHSAFQDVSSPQTVAKLSQHNCTMCQMPQELDAGNVHIYVKSMTSIIYIALLSWARHALHQGKQ